MQRLADVANRLMSALVLVQKTAAGGEVEQRETDQHRTDPVKTLVLPEFWRANHDSESSLHQYFLSLTQRGPVSLLETHQTTRSLTRAHFLPYSEGWTFHARSRQPNPSGLCAPGARLHWRSAAFLHGFCRCRLRLPCLPGLRDSWPCNCFAGRDRRSLLGDFAPGSRKSKLGFLFAVVSVHRSSRPSLHLKFASFLFA